jgi:hypothetical protein
VSAYLCPKCRKNPVGRYDSACAACIVAAASRVDPEPEPAFRTLALCPDCPHGCPEPRCAECAGSGDVIVSEPG